MGCTAWVNNERHEVLYQDAWVDGRPVARGGRECEFRYHAIRKIVKKLKRPINVLDIGANMGYFSLRLAEEFDGCFVMVEGAEHIADGLLKLCKLNRNKKSILLKRRLSLENLKNLAKTEHFDFVLALSIIHHFEEPYQEVFEAMRNLGSTLIFEPPIKEEHGYNYERIVKEPIGFEKFPHVPLIKIPTGSRYNHQFNRTTYLIPCKDHPKATSPGINYQTFLNMNGVFPTEEDLAYHKEKFSNDPLESLVLTGDSLFRKI